MPSRRIIFGETAAQRIVNTVRRVEGSPTFGDRGGAGGPRLWNPGTLEAIVTTAITACSGTTYGAGEAQIYIDDPDDPDNAIADPAYPDPVAVKNWLVSSGTVAIGKHVNIGWRNGGWRLISGDCP